MSNRTELLLAGRRAAEVLHEFKCREKIKSGYTRIDPVSIAHQANVTVMFRQLDQLLGGFIRESSPGILVNLARPRGMVHMTCAHELGHFFLGHETIMDREIEYSATADVIERQADQFAYSLLAPQWLIAHIARAKQWGSSQLENPQNIYQLSLRLGASYTATAWTLERLRLIRSGVASEVVRIPPQSIKKQLLGNAVLKDWNRDVWLLDETDRDHIIEPILGDGVVIDLANHSAAGYLWSLDEASQEGFKLEPQLIEGNDSSIRTEQNMKVGLVTNKMRYQVTPLEAYESLPTSPVNIGLQETKPWMTPTSSDEKIEVSTEYEEWEFGLTHANKVRRLSEVNISQ